MYNSIKYFEEECINRFEKLENDFIKQNLKNKTDEQVKNEWTEELEKIKAKAVKNQDFQELQHDEKIDSKFIK